LRRGRSAAPPRLPDPDARPLRGRHGVPAHRRGAVSPHLLRHRPREPDCRRPTDTRPGHHRPARTRPRSDRTVSNLKPTAEQQAILDAAATGGTVAISAAAGSGKTSTLRMIAAARPDARMLYVAFNKAIQLEADGSFPSNVACKTAALANHLLPYAQRAWSDLTAGPRGNLRPTHDVYLKQWQLSRPTLTGWDVVLYDLCRRRDYADGGSAR